MKHFFNSLLIDLTTILLLVSCVQEQRHFSHDMQIDTLLSHLTLEQKVHLCLGMGAGAIQGDEHIIDSLKNAVPNYAGYTYPFYEKGIPAALLCDGPAGLRIGPIRQGDPKEYWCTAFPIGTLLASSWNNEMVSEVGAAIGNEVLEYGVDVILAPGQNIHRHPLGGRNFEYFSEDPLLSGLMSAAYVNGVQSQGVGACVKHFACNNQETNRLANDAMVDQKTLREIYLKNFQVALRNSQPWMLMTSYNFVNDVHASESEDLLQGILRDEFGFEGLIVSDWGGGYDAVAQLKAGNNMIQDGAPWRLQQVMKALEDGSLSEDEITRNARKVLEMVWKTPAKNGYKYSNDPDLDAHAEVARRAGAEGMVLLKNEGCALPVSATESVALFGLSSYEMIPGGIGSGDVYSKYVASMPDAAKGAGMSIDDSLSDFYQCHWKKLHESGSLRSGRQRPLRPEEPEVPESLLRDAAAKAQIAVVTIGRRSGEWNDCISEEFYLRDSEIKLLEAVRGMFAKVIVVLNTGAVMDVQPLREKYADAILLAWQGGSETANAVVDILTGKVNPSGRLPMTFPLTCSIEQIPFPVDPGDDINITPWEDQEIENVHYTSYSEGTRVGYRLWNALEEGIAYPFGYGLSYTDFSIKDMAVRLRKQTVTVSVEVKNIGATAGKQVVQLYSRRHEGDVNELRAYAKTRILAPGESETVEMTFPVEDLAIFDEDSCSWVIEGGEYTLSVGSSSVCMSESRVVSVKRHVRNVRSLAAPREHTPRHLVFRG